MFRENCCCMWRVFGINDRHDKAFASESVCTYVSRYVYTYVYLLDPGFRLYALGKVMNTSYYVPRARRHFSSVLGETSTALHRSLKIQAKRGITCKINEKKNSEIYKPSKQFETKTIG
uniref:Uncharacterized protein n=1 Tax=Glossina palpalis gambiensis TaxID=67801 RepID=A0A1B0B7R2_9MUSC